jgi:hypothetical protein
MSTLFKSNDGRISAVCDDQYSSTLAMLEETADEASKVYMTRKTQGWFRGRGCPRPSDAAAPPGLGPTPGGAGSGAGAVMPARRPTPSASDNEEASYHAGGRRQSGAIANPGHADVARRGAGVGHMPSKTSRVLPAPRIGQARLCRRINFTLKIFMIPCPKLCDLPSDIAGGLAVIS